MNKKYYRGHLIYSQDVSKIYSPVYASSKEEAAEIVKRSFDKRKSEFDLFLDYQFKDQLQPNPYHVIVLYNSQFDYYSIVLASDSEEAKQLVIQEFEKENIKSMKEGSTPRKIVEFKGVEQL